MTTLEIRRLIARSVAVRVSRIIGVKIALHSEPESRGH